MEAYLPKVAPSGQNSFRLALAGSSDRFAWMDERFYSDRVASLKIFHIRFVCPLAHENVGFVLERVGRDFQRDPGGSKAFARVEGKGFFGARGEEWRLRRTAATPAFKRSRLTRSHDYFLARNNEIMANLKDGADVLPLAIAWSSHVNTNLVFSGQFADYADQLGELTLDARQWVTKDTAFLYGLPDWFPTIARYKLASIRQQFMAVVMPLIEESTTDTDDPEDMLCTLRRNFEARSGRQLEDKELADFVISLLMAGSHTTALGLTTVLYLAALFKDKQERLREEAHAAFGKERPEPGDYEKLTYTKAFVDEALRFYPPTVTPGYRANRCVETPFGPLDDRSMVLINIWAIHHNANNWEEPSVFKPERFLEGGEASKAGRYAYLPFGGGQHKCLGEAIVRRNTVLCLADILARFDISLFDETEIHLTTLLSLHYEKGVRVRTRPV